MEGPIKNNKESNEKEKKIITEEDFEYAAKQWKYKTIAWIFVFVVFAVILTSSITYYITIGKKYNDLYSATSDIDSEENVIYVEGDLKIWIEKENEYGETIITDGEVELKIDYYDTAAVINDEPFS